MDDEKSKTFLSFYFSFSTFFVFLLLSLFFFHSLFWLSFFILYLPFCLFLSLFTAFFFPLFFFLSLSFFVFGPFLSFFLSSSTLPQLLLSTCDSSRCDESPRLANGVNNDSRKEAQREKKSIAEVLLLSATLWRCLKVTQVALRTCWNH